MWSLKNSSKTKNDQMFLLSALLNLRILLIGSSKEV